ncbi:uncharacterized protein LOC113225914 [Hyposmocoma kahamanoa]|uniref:uncharacterized protein LOC113225914 n=1 Tax=Hyposmocoma kahamanoa TaxID=1477025 RepID=UPI000E6D64E5|nr:uncharacterized protein LOC113225914 [Hyposmocoma kahamanoa]
MNRMGPNGMDDEEDMTTCDGFSKNARFNPFSLVEDLWYAFYHWALIQENIIMKFFVPTTQELEILRSYLDSRVKDPINWTANYIVMKNVVTNITRLIVERNDRGWYWMYPYIPYIQCMYKKAELEYCVLNSTLPFLRF